MKPTKVVTYYRVSTDKQGLGIEAQRNAISKYLSENPNIEVIGSFTETCSGKKENKPEQSKAIELCKRSGATLLVSNLDRLGRGAYLYGWLAKGDVKFKALDILGESELEKAIRAAMAIEERKLIGMRTSRGQLAKQAILNEAKEAYERGDTEEARRIVAFAEAKSRYPRGLEVWIERKFSIGYSRAYFSDEERQERAKARVMEAETDEANIMASNAIRLYLKQGGKRSLTAIANYLNENNYKTRRGKGGWKPQSVSNLMKRFGL